MKKLLASLVIVVVGLGFNAIQAQRPRSGAMSKPKQEKSKPTGHIGREKIQRDKPVGLPR